MPDFLVEKKGLNTCATNLEWPIMPAKLPITMDGERKSFHNKNQILVTSVYQPSSTEDTRRKTLVQRG